MTESREELRQRIRKIGQMAMLVSDYPDDTIGHVVDGLEAVYAAALRDYRNHLIGMGYDYWVISNLEKFAASLGIDLDGGA